MHDVDPGLCSGLRTAELVSGSFLHFRLKVRLRCFFRHTATLLVARRLKYLYLSSCLIKTRLRRSKPERDGELFQC